MVNGGNKKICLKCGMELERDASFCPRCGISCTEQGAAEPTPIQQYGMNIQSEKSIKNKVDIKKTFSSNIIPVVCLVFGILLLFAGTGIKVPSDYISSYSMTEYVGGDAYNFIIEASLRGGRIAAAEISKCVYTSIGLLIACMSVLKINVVKVTKESD